MSLPARILDCFILLLSVAPAHALERPFEPGIQRDESKLTAGSITGRVQDNKTILQTQDSGSAGDASGMSVKSPDTGTIRALSALFAGRIDVVSFGAVCDGAATINTAPLQAAFNAAASSGREVFIPACKFDHSGLTFAAPVRVYGAGAKSRLNYVGTGAGITIADGTNDFSFQHLTISMAGDGSAFKFTGTNLRYEFANLVINFPDYAGTAARRGFDYNLAAGKYSAFGKFRTMRIFSAGVGLYVDAASAEVNNLDFDNVEFGACIRAVDARPTFSSGWTFKGGSAEVPSNGETQFVFDNLQGVTMLGVRTETKNGAWQTPTAGNYTTHTPLHFGPGAQKTVVIEPVFFPHTTHVYLHEGVHKVYIHGQDGIITDATLKSGSATISGAMAASGGVSGTTGTFAGTIDRSGPAGTNRNMTWSTSGSLRAALGLSNGAEGGTNAGSDVALNLYSDTGAYLSTPLAIARATGRATIGKGLSLPGLVNAANDSAAASAGVPLNGLYRSGSALMVRTN